MNVYRPNPGERVRDVRFPEDLPIDTLQRLGVTVEGFGCPEEYLASLASA